jgi:hypothetical protein
VASTCPARDDHRLAVRAEQDVGRLQVAVHDAAGVYRVERSCDLRDDAQRVARGDAFADAARQRAAGEELHRDVRVVAGEALVVDARDVLVLEARQQLVLAHEALEEHRVLAQRAVEHLERELLAVVHALGKPHLRLPALADQVQRAVARRQFL